MNIVKKSKFIVTMTIATLGIGGMNVTTSAADLNKFVRGIDGSLHYDLNQKIPMYEGSSEIVNIPDGYEAPKELFQSSWVATIQNLNFKEPTNESDFKNQYLKVLNDFKEWNMNAMIFQVRPLLDSWYPSEYNPWSEFLSGEQGVDPGYDPLPWMVEETHKAGLEYHAWLNPYRVSNTKFNNEQLQNQTGKTEKELYELSPEELVNVYKESGILSENNYASLHPNHTLIFDNKLFLNPGIPEVRQHIFDTVEELARNYDIDAIHFDDYFYPYRITVEEENVFFGKKDEDLETFKQYGSSFSDIDEWRRHNIDLLVEGVKETIDNVNDDLGKSIQFGISPFGIWEHHDVDSRGSNTPISSSKSYSESIFADSYKWIKEETVDYLAPQIYWSFDQAAAPYGELTRWWNDIAKETRTQIYIGHSNYKHVSNGGWDVSWLNPEEIPNQIKFNTQYESIKGSALFSYNDIQMSDLNSQPDVMRERHNAKNESIKLLKKDFFNNLSLVPAKSWLSKEKVYPPKEATLDNGVLSFKSSDNKNERFYILYSGEGDSKDVMSKSSNIIARIYNDGSDEISYIIPENIENNIYLTAVDAAGVESDEFLKVINNTDELELEESKKIAVQKLKKLLSDNLINQLIYDNAVSEITDASTTEEVEAILNDIVIAANELKEARELAIKDLEVKYKESIDKVNSNEITNEEKITELEKIKSITEKSINDSFSIDEINKLLEEAIKEFNHIVGNNGELDGEGNKEDDGGKIDPKPDSKPNQIGDSGKDGKGDPGTGKPDKTQSGNNNSKSTGTNQRGNSSKPSGTNQKKLPQTSDYYTSTGFIMGVISIFLVGAIAFRRYVSKIK